MQQHHCTQHSDMMAVFGDTFNRKYKKTGFHKNRTNTFFYSPGPCCRRRAQSRADRDGLRWSVCRYNKTVEAFEDNISVHYRVPTQVWCSGFQGFGRTISCRNEMKYIQLQVNTLGSLQTLNFSCLLLRKLAPRRSGCLTLTLTLL